MNKIKIPLILHIKGVTPQDCITLGSIFNNDRLLIEPETKEEIIPSIFESQNLWIVSCNRPCINCTLKFDSVPIPIATGMQRKKTGELMFTLKKTTSGNVLLLCSFECYINHIMEVVHNDSDRHNMLKIMEYLAIAFGVHPKSIVRGKNREELEMYGGSISAKKYRERITPVHWLN